MKCNCQCHSNPNVRHVIPCCNGIETAEQLRERWLREEAERQKADEGKKP